MVRRFEACILTPRGEREGRTCAFGSRTRWRFWPRTPARGLVVEGSRIAELVRAGGEPSAPVDAIFDASRHVVLPGLVNTHHHFYQTLTRAHPQAINKELFPWLVALYPIWARLKPSHLRLATRLALAELMLSGCTTAADHHYLFPPGLEDAVDIEVEAARELGMRMTVTRGSMNLSQKDGGLPPDASCRTRTRSSRTASAC